MRTSSVLALAILLGFAGQIFSQDLKTLSGKIQTILGEADAAGQAPAITAQFWAKGNKVRMEVALGNQKSVSIQDGPNTFVYLPGAKVGTKWTVSTGLASMGLVEQINTVRADGRVDGTTVLAGEMCDRYVYDVNAPKSSATVFFSQKTKLPMAWVSTIRTGPGKAESVRMIMRELKAGVEIDDQLFELPNNILFETAKVKEPYGGDDIASSKPNAKDSIQLACQYEVVTLEDGQQKGDAEQISILLGSGGYAFDQAKSPETGLTGDRIVYDRRSQRMMELIPEQREYLVNPIHSRVQFRVMEMFNRVAICRTLQSEGLPRMLACTRLELENEMGLKVPSLFEPEAQNQLDLSVMNGEFRFSSGDQTLCRFSASETELKGEVMRSFINFLAHNLVIHPDVRATLAGQERLPATFGFKVSSFQTGGQKSLTEVVFKLKSVKPVQRPDWNVVPEGFRESLADVTPEVRQLLTLLNQAELPDAKALRLETIRRIDGLRQLGHLDAGLAAAFRYSEVTGDMVSFGELAKPLAQPGSSVEKFLQGKFERSDFERFLQSVEQQDETLAPVAMYLLADTAVEQGWTDIDSEEMLMSALRKDPLISGAWAGLGHRLNDRFEMPSGWRCWQAARKIAPKHKLLQQLDKLAQSLEIDFPDYF